MRISKTNNLYNGEVGPDFSITGGGVVGDGEPNDITNPDFSYFLTLSGSNPTINVSSRSAEEPSDYISVHGVRFNAGGNTAFAKVYSDGVALETIEIKNGSSVFFTRPESSLSWSVEFFAGGGIPNIVVSISYISSGLYSDFPRSGVRGGEYTPFFGNNRVTLSSSNQLSQPVTRSTRKIAKQVTLKCPNAPIDWVETELQDIFTLYNETGILSVLMYDEDPGKSFAGFDLEDNVSIQPDSFDLLSTFTLKMKATL